MLLAQIFFLPIRRGITPVHISSDCAPTKQSVPWGLKICRYRLQSRGWEIVHKMKSREFSIFSRACLSLLETKWCAPSFFASCSFWGEWEKAVTSHPKAFANWSAKWPRPPMPMTPNLSIAFMLYRTWFENRILTKRKSPWQADRKLLNISQYWATSDLPATGFSQSQNTDFRVLFGIICLYTKRRYEKRRSVIPNRTQKSNFESWSIEPSPTFPLVV
jgi:hypothetical protein